MHDYLKSFPGLSDLFIEWEPDTLLYKVVDGKKNVVKRFDDFFKAAAYIREIHREELKA